MTKADAKTAYAALMKFYLLTIENLDVKIWRTVPDYEDYQVSNFERVKSFKQGKVTICKPVLVNGYLAVSLYKNNKQKIFTVHRLVAELFIINPENKPQVNHKNGHPLNNYVGNLEWATSSQLSHGLLNSLIQNERRLFFIASGFFATYACASFLISASENSKSQSGQRQRTELTTMLLFPIASDFSS